MRHSFASAACAALAVILMSGPASALTGQAQPAAKPAAQSIVNINTASAQQLESLPGIGPATAARIVDYRQKHGGFKKIEEIMNVRGIGEKLFLRMKSQLTVSAAKADPQ